MVYLISLSVGQITQCQMTEQLPDNKLERLWIGLQLNMRYHPSTCQNGDGKKKPKSTALVSTPRFEPRISKTQNNSANHKIQC